MPELPDLEVIAEFLNQRLCGARITGISVPKPIVARNLTADGWIARLVGVGIESVSRRGKFLLMQLGSGDWLVINAMRSGRLRYWPPGIKPKGKPFVELRFSTGAALHYLDPDTMGKVYLASSLDRIPGFASQGTEALDPELTLAIFADRLRGRRGEIKGILTNQSFVAGIGNAYADEILFRAGVYPFRKTPTLSREEVSRIYAAMTSVLREATEILRNRVGQAIHIEIRDFLQVHGHGGQPCPRCGSTLSQITARGRLTNFCRTCQPGTMHRK
jgi:formamidopyrimidine-DNA glycosylase